MAKVVVVGSINMDIVASAERHPKRGETIFGGSLQYFPGGKGANQAIAAARQEVSVVMVGAVGNDASGETLLEFLASESINIDNVASVVTEPTGTALIVVADADNTIVVVPGANNSVSPESVAALEIATDDVVVAQYETPLETSLALFKKASEVGAITILNPAPAGVLPDELAEVTDYLVVNETELAHLLSMPDLDVETVDKGEIFKMATNLTQLGHSSVVVTLGARGIIASLEGKSLSVNGHKVNVLNSTGAGDCFVGSFAGALANGTDHETAVIYANAAAALSVQVSGAGPSMPSRQQVEELIA